MGARTGQAEALQQRAQRLVQAEPAVALGVHVRVHRAHRQLVRPAQQLAQLALVQRGRGATQEARQRARLARHGARRDQRRDALARAAAPP
jgi:hypothetical protein